MKKQLKTFNDVGKTQTLETLTITLDKMVSGPLQGDQFEYVGEYINTLYRIG